MNNLTPKTLRRYLRQEMDKLPSDKQMDNFPKEHKTFAICFSQATFNVLMDIDQMFDLGAFYEKERNY